MEGHRLALMMDTNFFIAVIVATIVSFVIGGIWYARPVFGNRWMKGLGKTDADMEAMRKRAPMGFIAGLVGNFVAATVLAIFLSYARSPGVGLPGGIAGGLVVGFLVWLGFIATTNGSGAIFEGRSGAVVGINLGYSLISYLIMGAILGYWIV